MSEYEIRVIEYESALNKAMDDYFNARPFLARTVDEERIYSGGFRMAWDIYATK